MLVVALTLVNIEAVNSVVLHRSQGKPLTLEWAVDFSPTKFTTTLAAVVTHHTSRSNVLVYFYCSMEAALQIKHSGGIPVCTQTRFQRPRAATLGRLNDAAGAAGGLSRRSVRRVASWMRRSHIQNKGGTDRWPSCDSDDEDGDNAPVGDRGGLGADGYIAFSLRGPHDLKV